MAKKIYLHMGLHKTGTTSIQHFLHHHNHQLIKDNKIFYSGILGHNAIELPAVIIKKSRVDLHIRSVLNQKKEYKKTYLETQQMIQAFCTLHHTKNIFISDEALSLIRTQEEINQLTQLFLPDWDIVPILVLREKNEWLTSFKKQFHHIKESNHPESQAYYKSDSWIFQHKVLVDLLRQNFKNPIILQYQKNMVHHFAKACHLSHIKTKEYYLNKTSIKPFIKQLLWLPKPVKHLLKEIYFLFSNYDRPILNRIKRSRSEHLK